jgi:general secretion pathway protein I
MAGELGIRNSEFGRRKSAALSEFRIPNSEFLPRRAFSLLEVILALAILAGAIAVLSQVSGLGMRNAALVRDLTEAQLLCESKMAEITSGLETAQAQQGTPLGTTDDVQDDWLYSTDLESTSQTGLLLLRVTVFKSLPAEQHPPQFSLVRLIPDPTATTSQEESTTDTQSASSSSGGGT